MELLGDRIELLGDRIELPGDIISDLYRYQTPIELSQRRYLDPLWYREYIRILPRWSLTPEPWFLAAETGDIGLMNDLLQTGNLRLSSFTSGEEEEDVMIDGLFYLPYLFGYIELAIDKGYHDIALLLADYIFPQLQPRNPNEEYEGIVTLMALSRDDYLERFMSLPNQYLGFFLSNGHNNAIKLITKGYNKGFITQERLLSLLNYMISKPNPDMIVTAQRIANLLYRLGIRDEETFRKVTSKYRTLTQT